MIFDAGQEVGVLLILYERVFEWVVNEGVFFIDELLHVRLRGSLYLNEHSVCVRHLTLFFSEAIQKETLLLLVVNTPCHHVFVVVDAFVVWTYNFLCTKVYVDLVAVFCQDEVVDVVLLVEVLFQCFHVVVGCFSETVLVHFVDR